MEVTVGYNCAEHLFINQSNMMYRPTGCLSVYIFSPSCLCLSPAYIAYLVRLGTTSSPLNIALAVICLYEGIR